VLDSSQQHPWEDRYSDSDDEISSQQDLWPGSDPEGSEISRIEELDCIVDSLFGFSPMLEETIEKVLDREERQQAVLSEFPSFLGLYINHVSAKYPKAESSLVRLVAQGTLDRYYQLASVNYRGETAAVRETQNLPVIVPVTCQPSISGSLKTNSVQDSGFGGSLGTSFNRDRKTDTAPDSAMGDSLGPGPSPLSMALDTRPTVIGTPVIQHPGIRPPPSESVYSQSDTHQLPLTGGRDRPATPTMPNVSKGFFTCPICHEDQAITKEKQWK